MPGRLLSLVVALVALAALATSNSVANPGPPVIRTAFGIQPLAPSPGPVTDRPVAFDLAWPHGLNVNYGTNPVVVLDAAKDDGVITTNGAPAGDFRFYPVPGEAGTRGWILQIRYSSPSANTDAYFYAAYYPFLYRSLLSANIANRSLNFTYAGCVPACGWLGVSGAVNRSQRRGMVEALLEAWDDIPLASRFPYLTPFAVGGDRNTMEIVGGLIIDVLADLRNPGSVSTGERWDMVSRITREVFPRVHETPGLNPVFHGELIDALAQDLTECRRVAPQDPSVLGFLAATLPHPVVQGSPPRLDRLMKLFRDALASDLLTANFLAIACRDLAPHFDAALLESGNERLARALDRSLRVVRAMDGFETNAPLFLPLLRLTCPRQPLESEDSYRGRWSQIESLWLQNRLFLYDFKGGSLDRQRPPGLEIDPVLHTLLWNPSPAQAGTNFVVQIRATDSSNPAFPSIHRFTVNVDKPLRIAPRIA